MEEPSRAPAHLAEQQPGRQLFTPELVLGSFALRHHSWHTESVYKITHDSVTPEQHHDLTMAILISNSRREIGLSEVRSKLTSFSGVQQSIVDRYLNAIVPNSIFESVKNEEKRQDRMLTWKQWILDSAKDDELLQIAMVHKDVMVGHAEDEGISGDIDKLLTDFVRGVDTLQHQNYIGIEPKEPSSASVQYGDIFDTYLKERAGYYDMNIDAIVLGQGHRGGRKTFITEARTELPRVLTHEWVHALLGRSLRDFTSPLAARWIDEAITEIISKVIRGLAGEKVVEDGTYADEKLLLEVLMKPFKNQDFIEKMLIRAYTGDDEDREMLVECIDEAFGTNAVVEKVSAAINQEQKRIADGSLVTRAVEEEALRKVYTRLQTDPDAILLRGVDRILGNIAKAAQEPKK